MPASTSAAILRATSADAFEYSISCGLVEYFLLEVYPAFWARWIVQVTDSMLSVPLRRPCTVTLESLDSEVQISWPWERASATMVRASNAGVSCTTLLERSAASGERQYWM